MRTDQYGPWSGPVGSARGLSVCARAATKATGHCDWLEIGLKLYGSQALPFVVTHRRRLRFRALVAYRGRRERKQQPIGYGAQ